MVDGNNVIGVKPDGWWRDRESARRRLVADLARARGADRELQDQELTVFFDGKGANEEVRSGDASGVRVIFAPGGPDAADDAIVAYLQQTDDTASVVVVTSDSSLARRVRDLGAAVLGSRRFRQRLDDN